MSNEQASRSLACQVAEELRTSQRDPRRVARELILEKIGDTGPFLGEGTFECPWIVFDAAAQFYALYVRDRELIQKVHGRLDEVVCIL